MQDELTREPVSTVLPEFVTALRLALEAGEELVFLKGLNRSAGAKQAYHVTSASEAETILKKARPGDSISVFFPSSFPLRGIVDESFARVAREWLDSQEERDATALVVAGGTVEGTDFEYVGTPEGMQAWLDEHRGATVLLGTMAFWKANSDLGITAYVPDPDGVVRRGAY